MCRYGHHIYKYPYACFNCRKMFKQTSPWDTPAKQRVFEREIKCPQCGQLMKSMGHDFKAPKQNDVKQWKKVQILFEHGFAYGSCGCGGPGDRLCKVARSGIIYSKKFTKIRRTEVARKNFSKNSLSLDKM